MFDKVKKKNVVGEFTRNSIANDSVNAKWKIHLQRLPLIIL